jgi:cell division protein FtsL
MRTAIAVIALIVALGAAGAAGYGFLERTSKTDDLGDTITKLKKRLEFAERKVDELTAKEAEQPESGFTPQKAEKEIVALREKVGEVTSQVEALDTQIGNLRQSDRDNKVQIAKITTKLEGIPAGAASGSMVRKEDIEELIEERIKSRQPIGKEPPLSAVAARIGLEDVERKALEDILRKKKNEMMTLLKTPRADGSNMLDEFGDALVQVLGSGGGKQEMKKTFMKFLGRLTSEKAPGTDETYFAKITALHEGTRQAFKETLSEKQFRAFEALGIENATDIKIPEDPLGIYLMQRLQAAGVTPPGADGGQ